MPLYADYDMANLSDRLVAISKEHMRKMHCSFKTFTKKIRGIESWSKEDLIRAGSILGLVAAVSATGAVLYTWWPFGNIHSLNEIGNQAVYEQNQKPITNGHHTATHTIDKAIEIVSSKDGDQASDVTRIQADPLNSIQGEMNEIKDHGESEKKLDSQDKRHVASEEVTLSAKEEIEELQIIGRQKLDEIPKDWDQLSLQLESHFDITKKQKTKADRKITSAVYKSLYEKLTWNKLSILNKRIFDTQIPQQPLLCSNDDFHPKRSSIKKQDSNMKLEQHIEQSSLEAKQGAIKDLLEAESNEKDPSFIAQALNVLFRGIIEEGDAWAMLLETVSPGDSAETRTIQHMLEKIQKKYAMGRSENGVFCVWKKK